MIALMNIVVASVLLTTLAGCRSSSGISETKDTSVNNGDPTGNVEIVLKFKTQPPAGQIARVTIVDAPLDVSAIPLVTKMVVVGGGQTSIDMQFPVGYSPVGQLSVQASILVNNDDNREGLCFTTTKSVFPKIDAGITVLDLEKLSDACVDKPDASRLNAKPILTGKIYERRICDQANNLEGSCIERIEFLADSKVAFLRAGTDIKKYGKVLYQTVNRVDTEIENPSFSPSYFLISNGASLVTYGTGEQFKLVGR